MHTTINNDSMKSSVEPAVLNIEELMRRTGLGRACAERFGREAGARIQLSEKRIGYLKSKIDEELERRAERRA